MHEGAGMRVGAAIERANPVDVRLASDVRHQRSTTSASPPGGGSGSQYKRGGICATKKEGGRLMTVLLRSDPFEEVDRLTNRCLMPWLPRSAAEPGAEIAPAVDIYEGDDRIELRAELPGMKPEDVQIEVTDNTLTLSGERPL
jgi:hypothetical protein